MRLSRTKIDILDVKGQEAMRKVCRLAREVLDITAAAMKPGVTTDYLDEICHNACVEREVSELQFYVELFAKT
jgi:methionyl aminopeptidase